MKDRTTKEWYPLDRYDHCDQSNGEPRRPTREPVEEFDESYTDKDRQRKCRDDGETIVEVPEHHPTGHMADENLLDPKEVANDCRHRQEDQSQPRVHSAIPFRSDHVRHRKSNQEQDEWKHSKA